MNPPIGRARYYAVRYTASPDQIRIEKGDTPLHSAKLAFGGPIYKEIMQRMEFKDLGSTVAIIRSDKKRIEMLKDPSGWVNLHDHTFPEAAPKKKRVDLEPRLTRKPDERFKLELATLCKKYGYPRSIFLENLHHSFTQTDGTYKYPPGLVGDLLKQAKAELDAIHGQP